MASADDLLHTGWRADFSTIATSKGQYGGASSSSVAQRRRRQSATTRAGTGIVVVHRPRPRPCQPRRRPFTVATIIVVHRPCRARLATASSTARVAHSPVEHADEGAHVLVLLIFLPTTTTTTDAAHPLPIPAIHMDLHPDLVVGTGVDGERVLLAQVDGHRRQGASPPPLSRCVATQFHVAPL
uniref:Uncharacterized protein n=1 Tax=Oryza sativa subsp. japonica TaxID=39947 RepID=Q6YYF7_ORYSJ|nr:hypothetical protein [Oryza sativa Japonica Group]BAD16271.1 hypothetical protein [Oryza sativa Japonica Group]